MPMSSHCTKKLATTEQTKFKEVGSGGVEVFAVEVEAGEAIQVEEVAQVVTKTEEIEAIKSVTPAIRTRTKQATRSVTP